MTRGSKQPRIRHIDVKVVQTSFDATDVRSPTRYPAQVLQLLCWHTGKALDHSPAPNRAFSLIVMLQIAARRQSKDVVQSRSLARSEHKGHRAAAVTKLLVDACQHLYVHRLW